MDNRWSGFLHVRYPANEDYPDVCTSLSSRVQQFLQN